MTDKAAVQQMPWKFTRCWLLSIPFILLPAAALADVPFYFVFASLRFKLWWVVPLAIVIEAGALWYIFGLSPWRALLSATLINVGTAVLGYFVYPFVGMLSYPMLAPLVINVFGASRYIEVAAVTVAVAAVDTPIELALLAILSAGLGFGIKIGWKAAAVFFIANLVSGSILIAALLLDTGKRKIDTETRQIIEQHFARETALVKTIIQELPAHIDSEGNVDADWHTELSEQAGKLNFFELEVYYWGDRFLQVRPMDYVAAKSDAFIYSYDQEQWDGDIRIMLGTIEKRKEQRIKGTIEVLHYYCWWDVDGRDYYVRAILIMPQH